MSSRLNLNDNISDKFEFTIGGLDYDLKYPTMGELDPVSQLTKEREAIQTGDSPNKEELLTEIDEKMADEMYKLIIPVGHETPIKDTLNRQPFPVIRAFNKMMTEQLSAE